MVYHTLFWIDVYLFGARDGFAPPAPFVTGSLPEKPYTREQLQTYLKECRHRCQSTIENMSDEKAEQLSTFPWIQDVTFAELQIYSMRHVQEHASQLNLFLGDRLQSVPDWVPRAEKRKA